MTISKTAIYGKEQALQDIYSNVDLIQRFINKTKARLLQDNVQWQRIAKGAKKDLIDVLLAENAAASILTLVLAEINGGHDYAPAEEMVPSSEGTIADIRAKREALLLRREEMQFSAQPPLEEIKQRDLEWTTAWYGSAPARGLNLFCKDKSGIGKGEHLDTFAPEDGGLKQQIQSLVQKHNDVVGFLTAQIDELQHGPRHGWSFVDDDGAEWSEHNPATSGENEYATDVKPCTLLEFYTPYSRRRSSEAA